MKVSTLSVGVALLVAAPLATSGSAYERTAGPCLHVSIQNKPVNESNVRQTCDRNFSRTVQAGARNVAETIQGGPVNDNKVRQYRLDVSEYFARGRGR